MTTGANVIIFAFHGRQANVELQMPFIRRILEEHPSATFESWNFTRTASDYAYLQTLAGDRITVRNEFHGEGLPRWGDVFRHYAKPEFRDTIFFKLDDDVAFLESKRFNELVAAVQAHPRTIVSAETVNNGASTPHNYDLLREFVKLQIPLLDVHLSNRFAEIAHQYFHDEWEGLIWDRVKAEPTDDWLSINAIGLDHEAIKFVGSQEGGMSLPHIAGRDWAPGSVLGDEGACNMLPRIILKGFIAAHLTFGPQVATPEQLKRWRTWYAEIAEEYLA